MYVEGNPVNLTDPSGNWPFDAFSCDEFEEQIATAKKYVKIKLDEITTYVAGGISIQCMGLMTDVAPGNYNGRGIAQISLASTEHGYGEEFFDGKDDFRGTGVLCYILKTSIGIENIPCLFCNTKEELEGMLSEGQNFDDVFQFEEGHDPTDSRWAVEYMRRRIKQVLDICKDRFCGPKDRFIVAALAQNGPGFPPSEMTRIKNNYVVNDRTIDWRKWYSELSAASKSEFRMQWNLFYPRIKRLHQDGYWLPEPSVFNDGDVLWLKSQ
jgi:hypothetical protein